MLGPFGNALAGAKVATQNRTTQLWTKSGSDWERAISPSGSAYVSQTLYWYVGPPKGAGAPGTPPGCLEPLHNRTGQTATFEWLLTYRAYAAANCTGHKAASATVSINLVANLHFPAPPLFVFSTSPTLLVWSKTVHCATSSTGTVHTGFLNLTTPPFNLTKRTMYDFYSGVSTTASAVASGNASAYAGVTIAHAALVRVSCTC